MQRLLRVNRVAVLSALAVAVNLGTVNNPFVFDDRTEVVENASIQNIRDLSAIFKGGVTRPLVHFSYAIDHAWSGLSPFGFHLTNLLLHALVVSLFYVVVRTVMKDWRRREARKGLIEPSVGDTAFYAAALFAVHPMLTEAVGYVSSRSDLLSGAFVLAAFLLLRRAALTPSIGRTAAAIATLVMGLASKELAVMTPVAFLVYDRLLLDGAPESGRRRWWFVHLPALGLVGLAGIARLSRYLLMELPTAPQLVAANALILPGVFGRYLTMLVVPAEQSIVQEVFPVNSVWASSFLAPALALASLAVTAWILRKNHPILAFGGTWFVLFLLPSAALVLFDRGQPMAEHRVYVASCGFFLAVAYGLTRLPATEVWRYARPAIVAVLVAVLSVLTINRNQVWADPVRLWADAAAKAPNTWMAQYGLATTLREHGDCERAAASYRRAAMLLPSGLDAFYELASCLTQAGRVDDARHTLLTALAQNPKSADVRLKLAEFYERVQGNPAEARRLCTEAKALGADARLTEECTERNRDTETIGPR